MLITKKINNNVALATDEKGRELVVFGRGVGFPPTPYELSDTSVIRRVFRDVDPRMAASLERISDDVLLAAADIVDLARMQLEVRLNPNLAFTLADHLQFALEQAGEGLTAANPLEAEVRFVYPREYEVGHQALGMVEARCGRELPASEATAVALHLVAGEAVGPKGSSAGMHLVVESTHLIEEATHLVEESLGVDIDRSSFAYFRFAAHFRYLVARLERGSAAASGNSSLFREAAVEFPEVYACAQGIAELLSKELGQACTNEELLYLMMHVNRLVSATREGPDAP